MFLSVEKKIVMNEMQPLNDLFGYQIYYPLLYH